MTEEHKIFQDSLNFEYEQYKKMSYSEYLELERISNIPDRQMHTFSMDYDKYLEYSYKHYFHILEKCLCSLDKKQIMGLRGEANIGDVYIHKNPFIRMYWVVQDAVYYYISLLNPQMHKVNLMFIEFFNNKLPPSIYDGRHKNIFRYYSTPSSPYFKPLLSDYNIKYLEEIEFSPIFTLFLFPLKLTEFGKNNILRVIDAFGEKLEEYYLKYKMSLLRHHLSKYKSGNFGVGKLESNVILLSREAENQYRESKNIPKIGEGWIEETILYNKIKEGFPSLSIIQHGRPDFLELQHYDIWIPKIKVAIEYQGEQHLKPVEIFGGEKAFEKQVERDERKKNISIDNGVTLIYAYKGYGIDEIKNKIKEKIQTLRC